MVGIYELEDADKNLRPLGVDTAIVLGYTPINLYTPPGRFKEIQQVFKTELPEPPKQLKNLFQK